MNISATGSDANGAAAAQQAAPKTTAAQVAAARQTRFTEAFSNIVAVMMRDEGFGNLRLRDLEWLVLPPIMSGQWRLGQTRADALGEKSPDTDVKRTTVLPSAAILWASVSPEIDKRLSENLDQAIHLRPDEWLSGDNLWLIVAAGDKRVVPKFLRQLAKTDFKGKTVKYRVTGPDGKVVVKVLDGQAAKTVA